MDSVIVQFILAVAVGISFIAFIAGFLFFISNKLDNNLKGK